MLAKAKRFFRNPVHLLAVVVSLAVVGVGAVLAFNALAADVPDGYALTSADHIYYEGQASSVQFFSKGKKQTGLQLINYNGAVTKDNLAYNGTPLREMDGFKDWEGSISYAFDSHDNGWWQYGYTVGVSWTVEKETVDEETGESQTVTGTFYANDYYGDSDYQYNDEIFTDSNLARLVDDRYKKSGTYDFTDEEHLAAIKTNGKYYYYSAHWGYYDGTDAAAIDQSATYLDVYRKFYPDYPPYFVAQYTDMQPYGAPVSLTYNPDGFSYSRDAVSFPVPENSDAGLLPYVVKVFNGETELATIELNFYKNYDYSEKILFLRNSATGTDSNAFYWTMWDAYPIDSSSGNSAYLPVSVTRLYNFDNYPENPHEGGNWGYKDRGDLLNKPYTVKGIFYPAELAESKPEVQFPLAATADAPLFTPHHSAIDCDTDCWILKDNLNTTWATGGTVNAKDAYDKGGMTPLTFDPDTGYYTSQFEMEPLFKDCYFTLTYHENYTYDGGGERKECNNTQTERYRYEYKNGNTIIENPVMPSIVIKKNFDGEYSSHRYEKFRYWTTANTRAIEDFDAYAGEKYAADDVWTQEEVKDIDLYAQWEPLIFHVTYHFQPPKGKTESDITVKATWYDSSNAYHSAEAWDGFVKELQLSVDKSKTDPQRVFTSDLGYYYTNTQYDNGREYYNIKLECDGATFKWWSLSPSGTEQYGINFNSSRSTSYTLKEDGEYYADVYAVWNGITIQYNRNGVWASNMPEKEMVPLEQLEEDGGHPLSAKIPTCSGKVFKGWMLSTSADSTITAMTTAVARQQLQHTPAVGDTVTVYAKWSDGKTLTYRSNTPYSEINWEEGQSYYGSEPATETFETGTTATVKGNVGNPEPMEVDGFEFVGWNTESDGSGTAYKEGNEIVMNDNVTLYAQWKKLYTLKFDTDGGLPTSMPGVSFKQSELASDATDYSFTADDPAKTGYRFGGWSVDGTTKLDAKNVPLDAFTYQATDERYVATVKALWEEIQYDIRYYQEDETTEITALASTAGAGREVTVSAVSNIPAKTGYTGTKWQVFKGNATIGTTGTFIMPAEEVKLKPVYTINKHNVTYTITGTDPNPESPYPVTQEKTWNTSVTVAPAPVVEGYVFSGWTLQTEGVTVTDNTFPMPDFDVAFTGLFTQLPTHKVTYVVTKPDGATDISYTAPDEVSYYEGKTNIPVESVPVAGTDYNSEKYSFAGWTLTEGGVTVTEGKFTMLQDDVRFEGVFTENAKVTLQYDANNGTGIIAGLTKNQYNKVTETIEDLPDTFTRTGYIFEDKWSASADGSAPYYTVGQTDQAFTEDTTLYAVWKENTYRLLYEAGEAAGAASLNLPANETDLKYETGDAAKTVKNGKGLSNTAPTATGYSFKSWLVNGTEYAKGATVPFDAFDCDEKTVVAVAQWNEWTYKVTYEPGTGHAGATNMPNGRYTNGTVDTSTHTQQFLFGDFRATEPKVLADRTEPADTGYVFTGWEFALRDGTTKTYDTNALRNGTDAELQLSDSWFDDSYAITATAQWTPKTYTVTYQPDVPENMQPNKEFDNIAYGTGHTFWDNTGNGAFVYAGHSFGGWELVSPTGKDYTATVTLPVSGSITVTDDVTYKAVWTEDQYQIVYTKGEVAGTPENMPGPQTGIVWSKVKANEATINTAKVPTLDGYTFTGWRITNGGTSHDYLYTDYEKTDFVNWVPVDLFDSSRTATAVALWEEIPAPVTYTLKYDCNTLTYSDLTGLSNQPADKTLTADNFTDNQYTLTTAYPESDNFRFVCWSKTKNYVYENRITEVALSDFGSDRTCTVYAIWVAKLDVTYTCGIDEDDPAWKNNQIDTTHLFEIDEYTLNYRVRSNEELEHPFVYPGYRITKWKVIEGWENIEFPSQPSGGSTGTAAAPAYRRSGNGDEEHFLQFNTLVILHGNVTVEAVWEPISSGTELTVTYNANGGTGAVPVDSKKYNTNDTPTVLAKGDSLVKEGAEFVEWNTQSNGSGKGYQAGQNLDPMTDNVTLYAIWKPSVNYIVEYDGNGHTAGTVPTDNSRYAAGSTAEVKSKDDLERTGCTFKEWNTQANGCGTGYKGDGTDTIKITGNVKLYAIWLDANGNIVSPGTGESNLPMLLACNMALVSLLAGGLVLIRRKKAETQQTAQ